MKKRSIAAIMILSVLFGGCKSNPTDVGTNDTFPASNISYNQYIQPIFNTYCATIGCHNSYDQAGIPPLSLSSWAEATQVAGVIVPKNANASRLVQMIAWTLTPYMPPNRAQLSPNKIQAIKTWINEGAKNN